jgi:hypothetical protein
MGNTRMNDFEKGYRTAIQDAAAAVRDGCKYREDPCLCCIENREHIEALSIHFDPSGETE